MSKKKESKDMSWGTFVVIMVLIISLTITGLASKDRDDDIWKVLDENYKWMAAMSENIRFLTNKYLEQSKELYVKPYSTINENDLIRYHPDDFPEEPVLERLELKCFIDFELEYVYTDTVTKAKILGDEYHCYLHVSHFWCPFNDGKFECLMSGWDE